MKHFTFFLRGLMLCMCMSLGLAANADTTYKLTQVTSVSANKLYVFEQDGYVMINSISSSALQTTDTYNTTGLSGTEAYVWKLQSATGGFYIRSANSDAYLNNSSSTNLALPATNASGNLIWSFNFTEGNTVNIQNNGNSDRFLGFTNNTGSHVYKAYATSNLSSTSYPHAIKVYLLEVEEDDRTETTLTINGTPSTSIYMDESVVSPTGATVQAGSSPIDVTVTWSSTNVNVATVASDGAVTLVGPGSTTIKATYAGDATYQGSSASYNLTVGGAYTTMSALQAGCTAVGNTSTPAKITFSNVYVTGVKGNNAYLSDGTNGVVAYQADHGFVAGDKLSGTVEVNMVKYGNYQYEITGLTKDTEGLSVTAGNTLTPSAVSLSDITDANSATLVTISNVTYNQEGSTFSDAGDNTITYYDNFEAAPTLNDGVAYDVTGVIVLKNSTTIQICPRTAADVVALSNQENPTTAWYADNTLADALTVKTINKADGAVSFYLDTNSTGQVTYASTNEDVATISTTGVITPQGYGSTTITATTASNDDFFQSQASFTLNVADFNVDVLNKAFTGISGSTYADWNKVGNTGATYKGNSYGGSTSIQLRATSNSSGIIVPIGAGVVKKISVKWNSDTNNARVLNIYGKASAYSEVADLNNESKMGILLGTIAKSTDTELDLTDEAVKYQYIGIASAAGALYLDQIVIEWGEPIRLTTAGNGYATYCSTKALDFTDVTGVTAYTAEMDGNTAVFTPVEGSVPAGTGLLLKGTKGKTYAIPYVAGSSTNVDDNVLEGVTEATTKDAGIYVLMNVSDEVGFYRTSASFDVSANTAYLPAGLVSNAKILMVFTDDGSATGVESLAVEQPEDDGAGVLYNVAGQIVGKDYKGIVIDKNGKKYFVK